METIHPNNNRIITRAESLLPLIKEIGRRRTLPKGSTVIREGQLCDFFFFVEQGAFRAYRIVAGREVTLGFSFKGDIDTCPYAYINQLPATDTIVALADSAIIKVYKHDFENYIHNRPQLKGATEKLLADYIEVLLQRIINLKTCTAEENFKTIFRQHMEYMPDIPLMHIASYLGITQERLSRIRRKLGVI